MDVQNGGGDAHKQALALLQGPGVTKLIRDRLIDYLTFNSYHVPMYARPGLW
jgi:hypothetical protein